MDIFSIILIITGLALFEIISSIDNAVINAEVLSKMGPKPRRWFLVYGLIIAVFGVRFLLPMFLLWISNPSIGPVDLFSSMFSGDEKVAAAVEQSSPFLLIAGGVFLVFLFFHWLFLEPKRFGLVGEKFIYSQGIWFYTAISIILLLISWYAMQINPMMAFAAVVGSTAFFIIHGFKQNAELKEKELLEGSGSSHLSDLSKLMYLEVIDATFSIDGVIGAFAFTLFVPLILIGNGIGALVVREITVRNIDSIKKYAFLKNGAMYSIFFLGSIMIMDSFAIDIPSFVSPVITFSCIGFFLWKSHLEMNPKADKTKI
ncbi:MAG: DUF475 domain-containing protein [Candidatus Micrarchaeota archaeon]|nr:DUF475 domain-containing protein [Candidatus Micrarchaeota archaeon]